LVHWSVLTLGKIEKIGWIGTGVMGEPMCGHLMDAGYSVSVHSRTREKAEKLLQKGATWCGTPSEVAQQSDYIFTMVGSPADVRDVYFSDHGIFQGLHPGSVVIDMSTTAPSLSCEIANQAGERGAQAIDAPVSGGDVGAREASLSIMVGGDGSVVESVRPLFDCLGKSVAYMGPAGSGQHTKLCNQLVVAGTMVGVCEALLYASRSGLDCNQMVAAIRPGAAGCWTLDNLAPRIIEGDDAPGFMVDHFIKDLGIAVKEAEALGLGLPGLMLAHQLYIETQKIGHGESGTQALIHAIRNLS
jgi:3-hydroxyisobutyrate dehydrogenase